jgi:hypothetical protein
VTRIESRDGGPRDNSSKCAVLFIGCALYSYKSEFYDGFVGYVALDVTQLLLVFGGSRRLIVVYE